MGTHVFYEVAREKETVVTSPVVDTAVTPEIDANRKGYLYANQNGLTAGVTSYATTAYAGKVFGRLGQGKQNDAASGALGWRMKETSPAHGDNLMQVSVFPDSGTLFNAIDGTTH